MHDGCKSINSSPIILFFVILFIFPGCSGEESPKVESAKANYCPETYGCLNDKFIKMYEEKCGDQKKGCQFSFEAFFGEMDKVYFTGKLMVWFEECSSFPISEELKKTNTEMCQYIFFEKDKIITSYIRSYCLSEVKISDKDFISFNADTIGMVSVMDADAKVKIRKIEDGDGAYFQIEPDRLKLAPYTDDACIHSP